MTSTTLLEKLASGPVDIQFVKVNGFVRNMRCTLNYDIIAEVSRYDAQRLPQTQSDLITVFDLDEEGYRSFYFHSLERVNGVVVDSFSIQ